MEGNIRNTLLQRGIRPTANRIRVLEFLESTDRAVSLNTLEAKIMESDRVTIYRTLKTFEEKGLIHKLQDESGFFKYALCINCQPGRHEVHIHFSCTVCKETYCLPNSKVPEVELPKGFSQENLNLTIKGICNKCKT